MDFDIVKLKEVTIVTAKRGKFLALKGNEDSETLIGRPVRMIFNNSHEIPEFEALDIE